MRIAHSAVVALIATLLAAPLLAGCPNEAKNDSINHQNLGVKANAAKQIETAIAEFKEAVRLYKENHSAWYGLGLSYAERKVWKDSADAFAEAVKLKDDDAMYQMMYGIALYEAAILQQRDDQAKREGKKPEEIEPDLKNVNFDPAVQHLQTAAKLNGELWRAHFYLGRIFREQDKPQESATEFTAAIQNNPREAGPYIALAEMYRRWDFIDQAIQVTSQGTANVPGQNERSEVYFVLGGAYADKKAFDKAIEAYTHALEDKKDNRKAQFARGEAYFFNSAWAKAKKDLDEYTKTAGPSEEFNKSMANKMLMDIAAKQL